MKKDLWSGEYKKKDVTKVKIKIHEPLIKKYGHPVLVHAVEDKKTFLKILDGGKIKLPKKHNKRKKAPLMEKILGVDNSIFLSIGFDYLASYDFKFNFVFDWGILKESDYYWRPLPFKCYTDIMNWWYKNDRDYLYEMKGCNKITDEVVGRYLWGKKSGDKLAFFEYWKMEEIVFDFIMKYPKKKLLIEIAKKREENLKRTYPYSKVLARRDWDSNRCPEIIHPREIDLTKSPYFLGFFIEGKVPASMKNILQEKYPGKIIY